MIRVRDLRALGTFPVAALRREVGPFVLIQSPPPAVMQQIALRVKGARTVTMSSKDRLVEKVMNATLGFDTMLVLSPALLSGKSEAILGRAPDCDFVVADPSVSGRHARLRWSEPGEGCTVQDLGSTNGTFVNARAAAEKEIKLADGDSVLLGDAAFLFVSVETLHAAMAQPR